MREFQLRQLPVEIHHALDLLNGGIEDLNNLFSDRMIKYKDYFEKNDTIVESYRFVSRVVSYFCNKYRKYRCACILAVNCYNRF